MYHDAFQTVWNELVPSNIDLMPSTASAQRVPPSPQTLPSFSRYDSAGSSAVEIGVLAQEVERLPGTGGPAVGYCSLAPVMAGHIAHHLPHAVIVALDTQAYWFPLAQRDTTYCSTSQRSPKGRGGVISVTRFGRSQSRTAALQMGKEDVRSRLQLF